MKKRLVVLITLFFILGLSFVSSHGAEEDEYDLNPDKIYPISAWSAVGIGSGIFMFLIVIMVCYANSMNETGKKTLYYLIILVVSLLTIYLIATTLHLNSVSETKGPVHWHADFEIWACDKQIQLVEPTGLSNKQGVDLLHAHDDNRIHVEGVLLNKKAASIGAFFHALSGHITNTEFELPSREGVVRVYNGMQCNGAQGQLYTFVNGQLIDNYRDYVIAPEENVPPGDRIKIIFTEKPLDQIDPYIKAEPRPK